MSKMCAKVQAKVHHTTFTWVIALDWEGIYLSVLVKISVRDLFLDIISCVLRLSHDPQTLVVNSILCDKISSIFSPKSSLNARKFYNCIDVGILDLHGPKASILV